MNQYCCFLLGLKSIVILWCGSDISSCTRTVSRHTLTSKLKPQKGHVIQWPSSCTFFLRQNCCRCATKWHISHIRPYSWSRQIFVFHSLRNCNGCNLLKLAPTEARLCCSGLRWFTTNLVWFDEDTCFCYHLDICCFFGGRREWNG